MSIAAIRFNHQVGSLEDDETEIIQTALDELIGEYEACTGDQPRSVRYLKKYLQKELI